ncbi:PAAR domain-containing protein [Dyella sp. ASV21]|uniref:PAAR domain-containing protein n=1 Tax=Dyella sp. ASV21 TaxID=2795114 RepID=UPI0018EAA38D|nr:PAAR domain-containing protein [Dyella sp. ASV21]
MNFPGKRPVRVGDETTHGGKVLPVSRPWRIDGRVVVIVGDQVACPHCGLTQIVEGDTTYLWQGQAVAMHSHRTSCGAQLLSSLNP